MPDTQPTLFGPTRDRRPRRVLMHAIDAGESYDPREPASFIAQFECPRCGHKTDWMRVRNITEWQRGSPCPSCNTEKGNPE